MIYLTFFLHKCHCRSWTTSLNQSYLINVSFLKKFLTLFNACIVAVTYLYCSKDNLKDRDKLYCVVTDCLKPNCVIQEDKLIIV